MSRLKLFGMLLYWDPDPLFYSWWVYCNSGEYGGEYAGERGGERGGEVLLLECKAKNLR